METDWNRLCWNDFENEAVSQCAALLAMGGTLLYNPFYQ